MLREHRGIFINRSGFIDGKSGLIISSRFRNHSAEGPELDTIISLFIKSLEMDYRMEIGV